MRRDKYFFMKPFKPKYTKAQMQEIYNNKLKEEEAEDAYVRGLEKKKDLEIKDKTIELLNVLIQKIGE